MRGRGAELRADVFREDKKGMRGTNQPLGKDFAEANNGLFDVSVPQAWCYSALLALS